ncbi:MAG: hypothetical protein CVU12_02930 [Bacteroidetes bacterium HGW-Bacteroidetes-7]|jgi:hypothetical protein|nr:MAG: hypothetical protein CVU12_02930 [Bacteroidetes bacterium HGW-Bacteroidetes-7]
MKRIFIILASISFFAFGCTREEPVQVRNMKIEFELPSNFKPGIKYANKEVVFTSPYKTYKFSTDNNGVLTIPEIIPDEYTINTSWEISGSEYKSIITTNELIEDKATVLLRATLSNYQVFTQKDIKMALDMLVMRSLLISKVYFSGTKDNSNRNYIVDSFIEIYNNSDEVVYADGKYLALAESMSPAAYLAKDNPEYIYTRQICRFPGNGTTYPILPGKSIVIAARGARDHRTSASTSVNLADADFEVKDLDGTGNPDVKALPVISSSTSIKFFNLITGAPNAVFIFETDEDIMQWPEYFAPGRTSGERFRRVPINTVLDGVECLKNNAGTGPDVNLKRFQDIVDAGFAFINASAGYVNESIERKISSVIDGRVVLKDSNNSTQDFVIVSGPVPRNYDNPLLLN